MSRCFPYPPSGYTLSKASNDALIESIKLRKEKKKKAKVEKKERKKSKNENKEKQVKNKGKHLNILSNEVYGIVQKVGREEIGQWERSGITEELGLPCNSQDLSNSSDSTQNSNKRKRHESLINDGHTGGNTLRLRLPSQKEMEFKTSSEVKFHRTYRSVDLLNKNDNAGTSGASYVSMSTNSTTVQLIHHESSKAPTNSTTVELRSEESSKTPVDSVTVKLRPVESSKAPMNSKTGNLFSGEVCRAPMNSTIIQLLPGESSKALMNSNTVKLLSSKAPMKADTVELLHGESSKAPNLIALVIPKEKHCEHVSKKSKKQHKAEHVSKKSKKQHKAAKKYEKMIDHIPLSQADYTMDYEEDWLCRKNLLEPEVKVQTHNQISCASSSLLWSRAQYLHEADLYSLPYSIPY